MIRLPRCPNCHRVLRLKPRVGRVNHVKVRQKKEYTGLRWAGKWYCSFCGETILQEKAIIP